MINNIGMLVFFLLFHLGAVSSIAGGNKPIIAVDVGHCAHKGGASSARGEPEYSYNLAMAKQLIGDLNASHEPWSALLQQDNECLSLKQRAQMAAMTKADLFLSIHHNSIIPKYLSKWRYKGRKFRYCDDFPGYSVYFSAKNSHLEDSRRLAQCIASALCQAGFSPHQHPVDEQDIKHIVRIDSKTGLYRYDELAVLKKTSMPAVLIECGMIIDRAEELDLRKPEHMAKMSKAIHRGIDTFWCKRIKPKRFK